MDNRNVFLRGAVGDVALLVLRYCVGLGGGATHNL